MKSLYNLFKEIEFNNGCLYFVGGYVRDKLIGNKDIKDIDILVTNIPYSNLEDILAKYGTVNLVGESFGVLKFKPFENNTIEYDIAIPRKERKISKGHTGFIIESDHKLSLEDDLYRRDFTINSIALTSNDELIDPYNGLEDLKNKIIRIVNSNSFSEDPLRMLRAIQFASRLDFTIEENTYNSILENKHLISEISGERIIIELEKIIKKGNPYIGANLLFKTGLNKEIFKNNQIHDLDIKLFKKVRTLAEFLYLFNNNADFHKSNFNIENQTYNEIKAIHLLKNFKLINELNNKLLIHKIYKVSPIVLKSNFIPFYVQPILEKFNSGYYPLTYKDLKINGNDLIDLGIENIKIGKTLEQIYTRILNDELKNKKEEILNTL